MEIGLFNRVVLHGVIVEDLHGDTILQGSRVGAKISWRSLMQPKLDIRSVQLLDAKIKLYKKTSRSEPNFQFIVERLSSKDKDKAMKPLRLGSVVLRRVELSWDVLDKAQSPDKMNTNHLRFDNISASVNIGHLSSDSIQMRLRELSLHETSGMEIKKMSMRMEAYNKKIKIHDLDIVMPHSHVRQSLITASLTNNSSLLPLNLHTDILGWEIAPKDLAFLHPHLVNLDREITFSANVTLNDEDVNLKNISLRESSGDMLLRGDAEIRLSKGSSPNIRAKIAELGCKAGMMKEILQASGVEKIPNAISTLGNVGYIGVITYIDGKLKSVGKTYTNVGQADGMIAWKGYRIETDMSLKNVKPDIITEHNNLPTNITLKIRGNVNRIGSILPDFDGNITLAHMIWQGQTYENIKADGSMKNGMLKANLQSFDTKINANAEISGNIVNMSNIRINANIAHISGITAMPQKLRQATLTGNVKIDLPKWPRNSLEGSVEISDASISGWGEYYGLQYLLLKAIPQGINDGQLILKSDFADIKLEGPLKPRMLIDAAKYIGLRALGLESNKANEAKWTDNEWRINARLIRTDELKHFLEIPLDIDGALTLRGNIRADGGRMALTTDANRISIGSFSLKDVRLYLNGFGDSISVLAQAAKEMANQEIKIAAGINAKAGNLTANVKWAGNGTELLHGYIQAESKLHDIAGNKILISRLNPSEIVIGDTIWRVTSDDISYGKRILNISEFSLSHGDQSVHVNGRLSPDPTDSIKAQLKKINIAYILNLVNFDDVSFDGEATGSVSVDRTSGYAKISGELDVPDFLFNNAPMGKLDFCGGYDTRESKLDIDGHMDSGRGDFTDVKGYVSLLNKGLDLKIDSRNTNLAFLQRFVNGIFSDFQGKATGHCHLYGPFKKLDFEGDEFAEAGATIDAIGVNYKLTGGRVRIKPGEFAFTGFSVTDGIAGSGHASGFLRHTHLKNINYDFNLDANKLLVYDKPKDMEMPFFATAYGTGTMHLEGRPGEFEADVNMRPERGTVFTYTVDAPETFGDVKMVSYRDKSFKLKENNGEIQNKAKNSSETTTDIRLNMLFDVTPDAMLKIIMNEKTGDNITVRGNGPIRANFYNKGPFRMYGVFNIDEGNYRMNIQDVIRKDFQLAHGGTIAFNGDPYQGDLNMQAIYTVKSASLSDLNIGAGFNQNSVRVNCLLNFSGKVKNPQVDFDLDLPTVNEEEKQLVRNIISTEEDMNMQILYLLGIGRFYTYATPQEGTSMAGSQSAAAMKSFLSSTLSGQLNEIISNAVGSSNWSFGTNVSTGGADTNEFEVEGQLSGRLFSGRLLVNGNIGYRDKSIYNNNSFIGDFDVQYLLTPKGSVRLKAYSETNDRYFTKSSLTTQGIGIQLSRDFTNLRDLFNAKGRSKKKKEKKQKNK